jgi:hypothetical protein
MSEETLFEKYLTENERKEIVREEFTRIVRGMAEKDLDVAISNAGYQIIWQMIDENIPDDLSERVTEHVKKAITKLSTYEVFRRKDAWHRTNSAGFVAMEEAVRENKNKINSRVVKLIDEISEHDILDIIKSNYE